jgi:pimeloyl-ACP methyl ester carboxylesterase
LPAFPPLPPAVSGEPRTLDGRAGRLCCYVGGPKTGAPLLLVHSVNAAASAYEVGPVYDWAVAQGRRVYAPDLPGFGASERGARDYSIRLYTDAVLDVLDRIAADTGRQPVDALGLSLGCEFLARAAVEVPATFRSLTLVTPTGFARGSARLTGTPGASREVPAMHGAFNSALWGQAIFDLLVSRPSIGYFMRRTYGSREVDPGIVDYAWLTSHQPGARHAPYAFLSGRLFARDIRAVYERLAIPVWVPHATRGDFRDFSETAWAQARGNWRFTPMPTGAMPHFERPHEFMRAFAEFLARA